MPADDVTDELTSIREVNANLVKPRPRTYGKSAADAQKTEQKTEPAVAS